MTTTPSKRRFFFPADRIPQEIWANIFLECIPSLQSMQSGPSHAPILLCRVNRAWRSTALSLSELWSTISVKVSADTDIEEMEEGIRTWLGRSGIRPLAIALRSESFSELDPILDTFISFIGRWEEVQWELVGPLHGFVANIHLLHAPLLKRFDVNFGRHTTEVMEPLLALLSHSPHLTDFVWHQYSPQFHIAEYTVPWSQLTRFKTGILDVGECLKVLRLCPSLIDCDFEQIYGASEIPHDMSIIHQRLRALTVGLPEWETDEFFDHLTLPTLSAFTLESMEIIHCPLDSIESFLLRSGCSIQTFKIHTAVFPSDQLTELLCLLPTLTELSIDGDEFYPIGDVLLRRLTYNENAGELFLCPELRVITIAGFIASSRGMLAKMLRSRCCSELSRSHVACLQKATVVLFGGWDGVWNYSEELEAIRELDVVVKRLYPKRRSDGL